MAARDTIKVEWIRILGVLGAAIVGAIGVWAAARYASQAHSPESSTQPTHAPATYSVPFRWHDSQTQSTCGTGARQALEHSNATEIGGTEYFVSGVLATCRIDVFCVGAHVSSGTGGTLGTLHAACAQEEKAGSKAEKAATTVQLALEQRGADFLTPSKLR